VLFEMVSRYPLFNGKNEIEQIHNINQILGTPPEPLLQKFRAHASHMKPEDWKFQKHKGISFTRLLPHSPKELVDLLQKLLAYDPEIRIEA
jgi:serine/threonine protein kinase